MESAIILAVAGMVGMLACMFFSVRPLWPGQGPSKSGWRASTVWSEWLDRRDTLLFNLEDLAHEQRLGKISAEDFSRLQNTYKKDLVALLDLMESSEPPADFQSFLFSNPALAKGDGVSKACFKCKTFFKEDFAYCPKCGNTLTVSA